MQLFIGIDGGGTGSRAQAELADGRRTDCLTGGPANMFTDPEGATRTIRTLLDATHRAARTLGADAEPCIVIGLAGVAETDSARQLRAALPFAQVKIVGDVEIALKGAIGAEDGIVVTIGTGSVLARQRDGQMQRLGGYGFVLGDQASGAWIGHEALRQSLLVQDGLASDAPLAQALWQRFGTLGAMLEFTRHATPADFATLAPLVLEMERATCPLAGHILDTACAYLQRAIARLQADGPPLPVTAMGSLGPLLLDRLDARNGTHLPRRPAKGSALDGALHHARTIAEGQSR